MLMDIEVLERTFLAAYRFDMNMPRKRIPSEFLFGARGAADLFSVCNGATFEDGLYRLLEVEQISEWTEIASAAFPGLTKRTQCFASDWLGRLFALDAERLIGNQPSVVILEPGTGQILEIQADFLTFHCDELVRHADAALANHAFEEWRVHNPIPLQHMECAGYRIPLFLGGMDVVENMERIDMTVYWELCAQLRRQTQFSPEGTFIRSVS